MSNYEVEKEEIHVVNESNNSRLTKHTKLMKCSFCDTTNALKPFKHNYICEECIDYLKGYSAL